MGKVLEAAQEEEGDPSKPNESVLGRSPGWLCWLHFSSFFDPRVLGNGQRHGVKQAMRGLFSVWNVSMGGVLREKRPECASVQVRKYGQVGPYYPAPSSCSIACIITAIASQTPATRLLALLLNCATHTPPARGVDPPHKIELKY